MRRILICVAYDGTNYSGFQAQKNEPTVEGELNKALSALHKENITVIGASRTDAGVHALCNMAVYDTEARMDAEKVSWALNTYLPDDVRAVWSREVPQDFHPRHTLTEKTYEYHIWNERFCPPIKRLYAYHYDRPLNVELMNEAGKYLEGEHDFKSFCSVKTTAETTVRNIISVNVRKDGPEVIVSVTGNGFLYNMVRIIAGTLIDVGVGKRKPSDIAETLSKTDREAAGPTAPAHGLIMSDFKFCEMP